MNIKLYYKMSNVAGEKLIDTDYSAAISADPAKLIYWHFVTANTDLTNAIDVYVTKVVTFYCKFY